MDRLAVGRQVGTQIIEALGLSAKAVEAIDIRIRPDEAVSVLVRFPATENEFGELCRVLKHYTLHDEDPNAEEG